MNSIFLRAILPALFFAASALAQGAAPVPAGSKEERIDDILWRGDTLIAETAKGFYQASTKEKIWRKMEIPGLPQVLDDVLVQQGPESPLLVFYRNWAGGGRKPVPQDFATLTLSKDAGKTWKVVVKGRWFSDFIITTDGSFFAVEAWRDRPHYPRFERNYRKDPDAEADPDPGFKPQEIRDSVLLSRDMGATWKDITNNLPGDNFDPWLIQDPDHPGQVCVRYTSRHGLGYQIETFQADDATYQWHRKSDTRGNAPVNPDEMSQHGCEGVMGATYCETTNPTLSNFFVLPFMESHGEPMDSIQLQTGKAAYTFRSHGPKIITVKVVCLAEQTPKKFLDLPDEAEFWGVKTLVVDTGDSVDCRPRVAREIDEMRSHPETPPTPGLKELRDREKQIDAYQQKRIVAYMNNPRLRTVQLDPKHPYEREIDLSAFYDFSKPGSYKVQLSHNDIPLLPQGGTMTWPAIKVTITP